MENTAVSHLHPAGSFLVGDHPVPGGREEVWRFTPTAKLVEFFDDTIDRGHLAIPAAGDGPAGLLGRGHAPRATALTPVDRPAAIAAGVDQAPYLRIEGQVSQPIRWALRPSGSSEPGGAVRPTADHLVIEARPGASATVVLNHTGLAHQIENVEIIVGAGATLTVVTIQDWAPGSIHLGQHEAVVGPDAHFRHVVVSLGGDIVRLQTNVSYAATGGEAELYGVYFADAGQHLEHRLFIDHNQPKGVSQADYRGALQGDKARSVWVGDVLIRPAAQGIQTYESNKNLILTDGCRADAVPNLEIETGQIVRAGHSASTGRFDEEQLFYLESRGIDPAEARRLVVRGFFAAILARIGLPDVEAALLARVDAELAASAGPADAASGGASTTPVFPKETR